MRSVAVCVLHNLSVPAEAVDDLEVAVNEACANAVRHAGGSAGYSVAVRVDADGCTVEVVDRGPGFDPRGDEGGELDPHAEGGRGLLLIRALVDDVDYWRQDGSTHVVLRKCWPHLAGTVADGPPGR